MGESIDRPLVLLVEDDPDARALIERWLEQEFDVDAYPDAETCFAELDVSLPDAACIDLELPGMSGLEVLKRLAQKRPGLPVVVTTAHRDVEMVVQAMQTGAYDYLPKPLERTKLTTALRNAVERHELGTRLQELEQQVESSGYRGLIGHSEVMRRSFREIARVAKSDVSVLIQGESGTGKELVARAIHEESARAGGPFVAVNCAAIPQQLLESEFFGHERGAFTGAHARHEGRLERAHGGTLFLDEVAELDLALQAKLLRALQERSFHRVGGTTEIGSDFRVIAATHQDLAVVAERGRFRQDLYFRLAVFEIELPPLRERDGDARVLARHFLERHSDSTPPGLSAEVNRLLANYPWPGNVRELQNAMQRALVVCRDGIVRVEDLPPRVREGAPPPEPTFDPRPSLRPPSTVVRLEDMEKQALGRALANAGGNVAEAARLLGIGRTTIYRKMKKFGVVG